MPGILCVALHEEHLLSRLDRLFFIDINISPTSELKDIVGDWL